MIPVTYPFWAATVSELLGKLQSRPEGLTSTEALERLKTWGANRFATRPRTGELGLLLGQFKSPIILILLFAASLSFFLHDRADALIILFIVLVSGVLGFWQERGAARAVEQLLALVQNKTVVRREQATQPIPVEDVVPGDVVELSAGAAVPGDSRILESRDLFVNEAALTGETYPVEKVSGDMSGDTPLALRRNTLLMGSHVVSGTAIAVVVHTGGNTEFGRISQRLALRPQETDFECGVRRFGYLLMEVTLLMLVAIFAINVYLRRPVLDSFMFALALAVGLTPQLLPAIISVNLAYGAKRMARDKVIVKRLASIENLGAMNMLCSDKTGTLTEGVVRLYRALDTSGTDSERVLFQAYLNSHYETGFANPLDDAVRSFRQFDLKGYRKLDESPYDFVRKRLSILVGRDGGNLMVTKGAMDNILAACSWAEAPDGTRIPLSDMSEAITRIFQEYSAQGYRVLGLASRDMGDAIQIGKEQETEMTFLGVLVFYDPPKADAAGTILELRRLGVRLKIITGDNRLVAASVGNSVGLSGARVLTGQELKQMSDEALLRQAGDVDIYAEVEPNQKERILLALRKRGHVVGYMGDGINDATALHAADVSISVQGAVDVAKEAADIVLLEKDLSAVVRGVRDGRKTFANTLKYVFMATSANFGNMFSMAGASLFLPFLPLLPEQILLTNLLTDLPEMTIATDSVDPETIDQPRRWDIRFIRKFMLVFGLLSSVFDYLAFGALLLILKADPVLFRTGWFVESVVSACLIVLVVRSRRPFYRTMPSRYLILATHLVVGVTLILPYCPLASLFQFTALPLHYLGLLAAIVLAYIASADVAKRIFYRYVQT